MQKLLLFLALVAGFLTWAPISEAGNIVLVRMGGSAFPNDATIFPDQTNRYGVWTEQKDIGFTNTDDSFVVALTNGGHHVTAFWLNDANIADEDLFRLNTNDCLLISYSCNSGPFNMGSANNTSAPGVSTNTGHKWNTLITAPIVLTKPNLARPGANRLCWFTGYSSNEWFTAPPNSQPNPNDFDTANNLSTTASGKMTFVDQQNPLFAGITYTNNGPDRVMSNFFSVDISQNLTNPALQNYFIGSIPFPANNRGNTLEMWKVLISGVDQGWTNDLSPGGKILATMEYNPFDPGVDIPAGQAPAVDPTYVVTGVAIAEWPAGSLVWRNCGDGTTNVNPFCDTLAGYRLFIAAGTRDPFGTVKADGFFAGGYDLTADGTKIFLRAIDRAILSGSNPSLSISLTGATATVSWSSAIKTWKLQSSNNLSSWADVTSGVVNNSYTVPGGSPSAQFFRLTVK